MIYGYTRVSNNTQSVEKQVRNILEIYPNAKIIQEIYSGIKVYIRIEFEALINKVEKGDIIVFESISRMCRNAEEGIAIYFDLYDKGINLVFLEEHYLDTDTYNSALSDSDKTTDDNFCYINSSRFKMADENRIFNFNKYFNFCSIILF